MSDAALERTFEPLDGAMEACILDGICRIELFETKGDVEWVSI